MCLERNMNLTDKDKLKKDVFSFFYGAVGLSTSVWSKIYGREYENQFMVGYIHDVSGPFAFYWGHKLIYELTGCFPLGKDKVTNAAAVFGYCSLIEIGQGFGWEKGTFDPYDFLAYAAGVGLAVAVDRLTFGKEKKGLESLVKE